MRKMLLALVTLLGVAGAGRADDEAISKRLVEKGGSLDCVVCDGNISRLRLDRGYEDKDLGELCELRHLDSLILLGPGFTDDGLRSVGELRWLNLLGLGKNAITDAGLRHLEGLSKLETLILDDVKVTNAGVARLQKALPQCKIIIVRLRP